MMITWPSHIEHYNPNEKVETESILYSAPTAESDEEISIDVKQKQTNRKKAAQKFRDPSTIEHYQPITFQPPMSNDEDESVVSAQTTQETKRRKVNGSNQPLKVRTTDESKTKRIREVQVYSEDGTLFNTFPNCAEAARQMDVGKSRINRACLKVGGAVIDGMHYKYADPTEALLL
ncbi:hypothetical protein ACHAWO_011858 [Cyclotella atomus]|uniref:Nuclease-associated modular DNA-binding 1 domain-containing protein n=1 Tax=Cyclotella atomus TaxID=382360 RepID=A0ABD3PLL8_9STRA